MGLRRLQAANTTDDAQKTDTVELLWRWALPS